MKTISKVIVMLLIFVAVLGIADWVMIQYVYQSGWEGAEVIAQGFWMISWFALLMVAGTYYLFTKDKSETLAIIIFIGLLIFAGLEDITFYGARMADTGMPMDSEMCWFTGLQTITSRFMGETCVSSNALILNVLIFALIGLFIYNWLVKQKW